MDKLLAWLSFLSKTGKRDVIPSPIYFASLPYELVEQILSTFILSSPPRLSSPILGVIRQVCNSWVPHVQRLAFLSIFFAITNHNLPTTKQKIEKIQSSQAPEAIPRSAPTSALHLKVAFSATHLRDSSTIAQFIAELLTLVGRTLTVLEVDGFYTEELFHPSAQHMEPILFSLPILTELHIREVHTKHIRTLLRATGTTGGLRSSPSQIILRHNFEIHNEHHLLVLPGAVFLGGGRDPMPYDRGPNKRPHLTVFIQWRHSFVEMIEDLVDNGLSNVGGSDGVYSVGVWLKDSEETIWDLDKMMQRPGWRHWIQWDVKPRLAGETTGRRTTCFLSQRVANEHPRKTGAMSLQKCVVVYTPAVASQLWNDMADVGRVW